MDQTFSHERRVLVCEHCGAPFEVMPAGGSVQCRYCGTYSALTQRDERPVFAAFAAQAPLSDPERIARLRAQDGRPLLPPASLQALLPNGQLEPWKVNEAVAIWQATRRELRTSSDFEAAERLLFLTIVLSQYFFDQGDRERQRALFESALEVFALPRHRQLMLCYLSRAACRAGDLAAAQSWLAQCDPRSDDLAMDSAYRFSRAFIETAHGNFPAVLGALGNFFDELPIQDALDASACALRANALEKLGNVAAATQELRTGFSASPALRSTIEKFIEIHPSFGLCLQSLPLAEQEHAAVAGRAAAEQAGAGAVFGWVFTIIGVPLLTAAVILSAIELAPLLGFEFLGGPPVSVDPYPIMILVFGIIGVSFSLVGGIALRIGRNAQRLRVSGLRGQARVLAVVPTNMSVNDLPLVKLQVSIELPGRPPYNAETKAVLNMALAARAVRGALVPVRVDAKRPDNFSFELD